MDKECFHSWSEDVYDPIYHDAYTIPGDPPGTMGVIWRGPCHVPAKTEDRWKHICRKCGKIEFSKSIKQVSVNKPVF